MISPPHAAASLGARVLAGRRKPSRYNEKKTLNVRKLLSKRTAVIRIFLADAFRRYSESSVCFTGAGKLAHRRDDSVSADTTPPGAVQENILRPDEYSRSSTVGEDGNDVASGSDEHDAE